MGKLQLVEVVGQQAVCTSPRPQSGTRVWIAIDIARTKMAYCVRWGGVEQRRLSSPLELRHVQALIKQYQGCQLHVAYEACGFGYEIAWWLQEQGVAVTLIAPSRVERPPGRWVKTDRLDASNLARKLENGELKSIHVPSRTIHEQRVYGRTYAQCIKERKRAQVRIRALMQEHGKLGPMPAEGWPIYEQWLKSQALAEPLEVSVTAHRALRQVADQQAQCMRAKLNALATSQVYGKLVIALRKQPGVGTMSAIRLVLELADMSRFATTGSLPHYLGLTPSQYSSGPTDHRGHILKCGPGALRALLIQCAWAAVRCRGDQDLVAVFERLAPRIGRKRAIVAVARRLVIKIRQIWLNTLDPTPV